MKMEFSLVQFEMYVNTHTHTLTQWERFKWINIEHSEYEQKIQTIHTFYSEQYINFVITNFRFDISKYRKRFMGF